MVDQTVFEKDGVSQEIPQDLVAELVGEGKKFKTVEDLAQGKLQSDIHIKRLEEEARVMNEKLASAKSVEDILEAVKANTAVGNNLPNKKDEISESAPASLSADQIAKIVAEQVTGLETARTKAQNKQKANDLLVGMFGDKAAEIFNSEASTPEMRATLTQLAEVSPEKFAQYFKREGKENVVDNGAGGKNTVVKDLGNGGVVPGTQAYYSKLRKENPKLYYSAATQLAMHDAALKDPAKYFGR